jgi:hypothetical protein
MTILRLVKRYPSWEMYEAVNAALDFEHQHPLGLIMHGAVESDGMIQVAQVWESAEYARRFDVDRLRPALEAVGAPLDAEINVFELHHLVTP